MTNIVILTGAGISTLGDKNGHQAGVLQNMQLATIRLDYVLAACRGWEQIGCLEYAKDKRAFANGDASPPVQTEYHSNTRTLDSATVQS